MAGMSFGTTATLAGIGTAIAPGIGTLIGAGLGFVADFGSWLSASQTEKKADALQAESSTLAYETSILGIQAQIDETNANVSAYESFLSLFPNYSDLQKNTFEAQSRQEFKGLLSSFGSVNANAGATGRVGGSVGLAAAEARKELADYAGEDLSLGGNDGGRYEMAQTELYGTLDAQFSQAQNQLGVLRSSLGYLSEAKGLYESALAKINQPVATTQPAQPAQKNTENLAAKADAQAKRADRERRSRALRRGAHEYFDDTVDLYNPAERPGQTRNSSLTPKKTDRRRRSRALRRGAHELGEF